MDWLLENKLTIASDVYSQYADNCVKKFTKQKQQINLEFNINMILINKEGI